MKSVGRVVVRRVVLFKERIITVGRVGAASGVAKERERSVRGVFAHRSCCLKAHRRHWPYFICRVEVASQLRCRC